VSEIAGNVAAVRARIGDAARRSGRESSAVRLVAATKTVPVEQIAEAVAAGVTDVGENRAQELLAKAPTLAEPSPTLQWHFVGALQRNKVRALATWVAIWQTVDREELGIEIARRAAGARVLVEVNLGAEPQKAGCVPGDAAPLVDALRARGLRVEGLMAIPPADDDPRPWFASLRDLAARLELRELSMGMTDDFETAIEEGATIVRVGRAIFGSRSPG